MWSNVEMVQRAYEGYARRVVDPYRELFAEGFRFHMRPEFPIQGSYRADEMQRLWADLDETFSEWKLTPLEYEAVGDYVVVALSNSSRLRGSEVRLDEPVYHVWLVSGGLIREAWTFTTHDEALQRARGI